jgi:DNA-directed RNA polymerase specialized sigma24 family protein
MLLPKWRLPRSDDHHERAFIERLGKVLLWARQITAGDTSLAEDLAQDAFLHFTAGRPPLDEISNLDKYLYVVLKNLFRSHLASVSRRCVVPFDPLAHENAMQTWRSVNPERRLTLRDELRRICLFICERKETSKGASAFLLHFFHGLSLADVGVVMQTTRGAVDERLSVVRKETRRWLDRPGPALVRPGSSEVELMVELQSIIASTCRGECFSADEVRLRYAPGAAELPKDRLAHLASCSKCLGLVAELLDFPKDFGSPPAAPGDQSRICRWQRKRTELLSTDPHELRLIVNGHLLATERVHGPDSDFSVSVVLQEPLDFVEIWSGETIRLLFLSGISEPPLGRFEQAASLDLNGRRLQLNLRFTEPWPTIAISFQAHTDENVGRVREKDSVRSVGLRFLSEKMPSKRLFGPFSIPAFSAVVALAMIFVWLFVQTRETTLGAAELLNKAEKWQQNITTADAPVLHRRFSLIALSRGSAVQRTFVEVWRRAGVNVKLSRWTDTSGRVLAEGRLVPSALSPLDQKSVWQFEPSADAFAAAAGLLDRAKVSTADGQATIRTGSAELVLDRATNRPVEERLSLNTGDYLFSESSTETIPLAASPFSRPLAGTRVKDNRRFPASSEPRPMDPPIANVDSKAEERELEVRRELHVMQLASAVAVVRDGDTINVQLAPTSIEQEQQLRIALGRIPGVIVSIFDTQAAVLDGAAIETPPVTASPNVKLEEPLATKWLKAFLRSPSQVHAEEELRVDAARRLVGLVAEWRLLAERYPVNVEGQLSTEARPILAEIVDDLGNRIRRGVNDERIAVAKLLDNASSGPNPIPVERPCEAWQWQAVRAADLLWENDQAIDQFYAPAPSGTPSNADNLRKLRSLTDALDAVLQGACNNR